MSSLINCCCYLNFYILKNSEDFQIPGNSVRFLITLNKSYSVFNHNR
jgi:hypothetical protein